MTLSLELITVTIPASHTIGLTSQPNGTGLPMFIEPRTDDQWRGHPARRSALVTLVELTGPAETRQITFSFDDSGDEPLTLPMDELITVTIARQSGSGIQ